MKEILQKEFIFTNEVVNKKKLQGLMEHAFHNYGVIKSSMISDKVKNLTFHYATVSGISLSVEDLRVPFQKQPLIGITTDEVDLTEQNYSNGNITTVERFQKVIDIWNNANNYLKEEVLTYFRESDPLNPLYIMAFSGARGNISQVRQLVGMRGLMADPQGQIIDLPIKSNFREGLKVTEYIISSYGARKGLVDTALRTADSGYLTRRLVDVAQDIIVREEDCLTNEGLSMDDLFKKYKTESSFKDRLIGRLLVKPFTNVLENKKYPRNTEVTGSVIENLTFSELEGFEVRSPLTCASLRSVCRNCYGWHLSYSTLVDLGEAVGILAAQSIGEPGTQLTMRTFHTGGVFSGDLTKQIRAPFAGTLRYQLQKSTSILRTLHGEKGFELIEDIELIIEKADQTLCSIAIPSNALLLVSNLKKVYRNQVIAEIKKDANLVLEEDRKNIYTEVSGEIFLQNITVKENIDSGGAIKKISKSDGLLWVLAGDRYPLQGFSSLAVKVGQNFNTNETLASQKIYNNYSGLLNFDSVPYNGEIKVINSSMILENGTVTKPGILSLVTPTGIKEFNLCVKNKELLKHGQKIASLAEELYRTQTGGVIFYSKIQNNNKKKRVTKKLFTGSLYWIPEETHQLSFIGSENLKIKEGSFVKQGTEILPEVFSNIEGFAHFNETTSELIIKPGELYKINNSQAKELNKINRFIEPGEKIFITNKTSILIQKLSYLEILSFHGSDYIILRPVSIFQVPQDKGFLLKHRFFPNTSFRGISFITVKRIFYKDGERIKSNKGGVDLLQTFLVLDIKNEYNTLQPQLEYISSSANAKEILSPQKFNLKVNLYERIKANETTSKNLKSNDTVFLKYLMQNNQYAIKNTAIAKIEILTQFGGTLVALNKENNIFDILILKDTSIKKCSYNSNTETLLVKKGDLVRIGTFLTSMKRSKYSGQIAKIENGLIYIRLGRPYLISEGTVLNVGTKSLVEKLDLLATLVYDKLKTVDIVQGLPKVEEILEARKIKNGCILAPHEGKAVFANTRIDITKPTGEIICIEVDPQTKPNFSNGKFVNFLEPLTDGPISPHEKLDTLFNYYQILNPVHTACKKSLKYLQLFLVNEVQRTYRSQGVQIADKHLEIIIKQMTSKVRVYYGGDTTLLPGEILDINQAELITHSALSVGEESPLYKPMLLGLTKASLNSDSFISAASFQETTRVLTEAAIEGKKDWLNGLKENVIIGRLIPAGTGFNCFDNLKKVGKNPSLSLLIKPFAQDQLKAAILSSRRE
jgi:DNA-directed RNA polymerase subunit beta'